MSEMTLEQWINIKFCVEIGRSVSEMLALLKMAYCEHAMKKLNIFSSTWENVHNDVKNGESITERTNTNIDKVQTLLSVWLIEKLNMNRGTMTILLHMIC